MRPLASVAAGRVGPGFAPSDGVTAKPTILVATIDPQIRNAMVELFQAYRLNTFFAKSLEEVKSAVATGRIAACFSGFWLIDGTYRDIVKQLRRQPIEIPVIIVCAPECPQEYREYLAALHIRAFDFICHPYRRTDFERILEFAIGFQGQSVRHPAVLSRSSNSTLTPSELGRAS